MNQYKSHEMNPLPYWPAVEDQPYTYSAAPAAPCAAQQAYVPQQIYIPQQPYAPQQAYAPQQMYTPRYDNRWNPAACPPQDSCDTDEFDWLFPEDGALPALLFADTAAQSLPAQPEAQGRGRNRSRVLFDILFCLLIVSIIGGSVLFAFSENPQKNYFGYRLYAVQTPSMTPKAGSPPGGFKAGALILIKMCKPETIQVGDIITYVPGKDPGVYLTHRVVQVLDHLNEDNGLFFITKGDANQDDDPPIAAKAVVGKKVAAIPTVGLALDFIRANYILCLITILSAFGFVILLRMYLSGPAEKKKIRHNNDMYRFPERTVSYK